jgi:hypothetical protein
LEEETAPPVITSVPLLPVPPTKSVLLLVQVPPETVTVAVLLFPIVPRALETEPLPLMERVPEALLPTMRSPPTSHVGEVKVFGEFVPVAVTSWAWVVVAAKTRKQKAES